MNTQLKIASNTFYQVLSRLVSSSSVFLATILITRSLSKEVWGDFVVVTSYVGIFTLISDFGLNAIFLKSTSTNIKDEEKLFQNLLGLRVVLALVAVLLALSILVFLPYSNSIKFATITALVLIVLQGVFNTGTALFQARQKYELYALSDILGSIVIVLLVFLATSAEANLLTIVGIFIVGNLTKAILSLFLAKQFVNSLRARFDFGLWKAFLFSSLPVGLMLIFSQINASIDKQIIALTSSERLGVSSSVAAGIYGLSYRIFDFVISLSTFVANSFYPVFLERLRDGFNDFNYLVKRSLVAIFLIGLAISLSGWLLTPLFLSFFGSYQESIPSLRILFVGVPIFYLSSLVLWVNISLDQDKFLPFIYGFAALLNLVLNLALIPIYGYNMAAWVTVITELVIFILIFLLLFKRRPNESQD